MLEYLSFRRFLFSFGIGLLSSVVAHVLEIRRNRREILKTPIYEYADLNSDRGLQIIRILELHPGSEEDDIHISLQEVPLNIDPEYEAISYCWGNSTDKDPILCDGLRLDITESLYTALLSLRYADKPRMLWADAVCINQSDNNEKSQQVQLMRLIYQKARRVVVWLGEEADLSDVLEQFIPRIHLAQEKQEAAGDKRHLLQMKAADREKYDLPSLRDPGYRAMLYIACRPWFNRVWIVQELALARDAVIHCGGWSLPWDLFQSVYQYVITDLALSHILRPLVPENPANYMLMLEWTLYNTHHAIHQSLSALLLRHVTTEATNPRDKVYALCGLADDVRAARVKLVPDYNKDVPQVFKDAAVAILRAEHNLDILSAAGLREDSEYPDLPSWVPEWRVCQTPIYLTAGHRLRQRLFDYTASLDSLAWPQFSDEDRCLSLKGHIFDEVDVVGPCKKYPRPPGRGFWKRMMDRIDSHLNLQEWKKLSGAYSGKMYVTGEDMLDVYWQTLILGMKNESFEEQRRQFLAFNVGDKQLGILARLPIDYRNPWFKPLFFLGDFSFESLSKAFRREASDVHFSTKLVTVVGRKMVRSKRGFLGMATGAVRPGDRIALFEGGRTPLVIRQCGSQYQLVGDAYVHGIMCGEAFDPDGCSEMQFI
jgi:hypothetical protein